ncbi:MAG: hypothetical protein AAF224_10835 [Pseudomonadota bacterium]
MATNTPRAVFVTRETEYHLLLARHATRDQARFFLETRGQSIGDVEERHHRFERALQSVRRVVPGEWRQAAVSRANFDRFLFGPEDVVIAVGQDGLIANIAKYLTGQPVLGVNPDPLHYDGVLVRHAPDVNAAFLKAVAAGDCEREHLTMAEVRRDDGERLRALNEIFVGHASHQSARYEIEVGDRAEVHSSSGMIIATGTGVTGWARSIMEATNTSLPLARTEKALDYFAREPFPSIATQTTIRAGRLDAAAQLKLTSRLNSGGVIFADGIEQDFLDFDWGRKIEVGVAEETVQLV